MDKTNRLRTFRRGALLPAGFVQDGASFHFGGDELSLPLRTACFYFDLAIKPSSNMILIGGPPELEECGFLRTHMSRMSLLKDGKTEDGELYTERIFRDCLASLPSSQHGRWSLVGDHPQTGTPREDFDTIYLELLGHFPVPSSDVGYKEILDFNRKNRANLLEFRNSIAEFSHQILASGSERAISDLVKDKLSSKLEVIEKHSSKSIAMTVLETFALGVSVPSQAIAALLATLGVPPSASLFVGNAIKIGFSKSPVKSRYLAPDCHYVLDAHKSKLLA